MSRAPVVALLAALSAALAPRPPETLAGKRSPRLRAAVEAQPAPAVHVAWVYLRDKGPRAEARLGEARATLSARALARRALRGRSAGLGLADLPVPPAYLQEVARRVTRVRQASRWFNAISVEATADELRAVEALPFVERLDLVRRYRSGAREPLGDAPARAAEAAGGRRRYMLDYGPSRNQLEQLGVPQVHEMGLHGEGTLVAVFDAGFNNLAHEAFSSMAILAQRDFVNGDEDVADGRDQGEGSHGTATLSVLGGFREGQLIGPAFAATFVLAKTENTASETPVEEDNWAAAAEWAEALGADVISSSLGYLDYDSPFPSYTFSEMNGETAVSTRAADLAAEHGVVVVNSAGNSGFHPEHNTLGAPADGRRVLAAGAVDPNGVRAGFSSVGPSADGRIKPDVAAQGVAVRIASPFGPSAYGGASGTSFSCPLVAGVAALVLEAHPEYSVDQVAAALRLTARNAAAPDNLLGWGVVNALAAVQAPAPEP